MQNVKKLLVPIDFSLESENALKYASTLASEIDARLIALHIVEDPVDGEGFLPFILPPEGWPYIESQPGVRPLDILLRERALDLWHFVDQTIQGKSPTKIKRIVRLGKFRKEIAAVAREENVDLIVLELSKRILFPTLATRKLFKIVSKLPYPVLLAPPVAKDIDKRGKRLWAFHPVPSETTV